MTLWKTPDGVSLDALADEATIADLLAAVRRGVESGTIKGIEDVAMQDDDYGNHFVFVPKAGRYLVIPVSDGGSET